MPLLQEIKVPLLSVNDTTLTVADIPLLSGQMIKKGDLLMIFETSKTTYDVEAETDGYVQYFCETGQEYGINEVVAKIFTELSDFDELRSVEARFQNNTIVNAPVTVEAGISWEGEPLFSGEADQLILSSGTNRSLFKGKDFISKSDIERLLGRPSIEPIKSNNTSPATKLKAPLPVDHTKVIVEKLSSGKKKEIEYLSDIQSTGLTSTVNTFVEVEGLFLQVNKSLQYLKNSLLPLLIYETARLLKKYPLLNAFFTDSGTAYYKDVNIGFAIDIDKGLKVLKLPLSNEKDLAEIETAIIHLSEKYLDDKLEIDDLTDIGFTITDLSAEGVAFFRPLVNKMNSAILGVSAIDEQLNRCILSVTFDHRVTEGKLVARFLRELKERIESYRANSSYRAQTIACFKCLTILSEDLSDVGFAACVMPDGKNGYICQRCFKGF